MMRRLFSIVLCGLAVQGCAVGITPAPPAARVTAPIAWRAPAAGGQPAVSPTWWDAFGDPELRHAVEAALLHNLDIAAAETRVREADALFVQAHSALVPTLTASVAVQDAQALNSLGRASDSATAQPQLQIAYEVDLWRRLRQADASARALLQASQYGRAAVALSIAGATARGYIGLASLDAQLQIARETLASRDEALRLATRRADNGVTSRLELTQARSEREGAAQRVPALVLAVERQENGLRLLLGGLPGPVPRGAISSLTLPTVAPGLPSELLQRRPDISQAEAQVRAADAALAASKAALLPQVRLTGSVGELFVQHLDPVSVWSVGGSALATIFDAGRLSSQVAGAEARRDASAYAYRHTVLNAFSEAENALEGVSDLTEQRTAAERQRVALREALHHATSRYRAGYASYLEQLDAQRGLLSAELAVVQLQEAQLSNSLTLYQALGGGWSRGGRQAGPDE
uniref:RND efflux system, outer membrane lipoprotein, NodT family n=1 Tax=Caulobacter sp. (strain K31) TaxID=366602 RepID=B0T9Y4_CAUSK